MSLHDEIKTVLSPPHNLFNIINQFEEWSKNQHKALLNQADAWVLQLYTIDVHFFLSFLTSHIPVKNQELIREVLKCAEADEHQALFSAYYAHVPPDYINQEIQEWIAQKLTPEQIVMRFRWRTSNPQKLILSEASCIAIYEYAPQIWETEMLTEVFYYQHQIRFEKGKSYEKFREIVAKAKGHDESGRKRLIQMLLQLFGSTAEKRVEAKRIIETARNWLNAEALLNMLGLKLNDEELGAIQKRFTQEDKEGRKTLNTFLINNSDTFARRYIESELAKATSEAQMEVIALELRDKLNWNRFYDLADYWLLKVYDVAPNTCLFLVTNYGARIQVSTKTATALLKKVQQRKHREMLRFVYAQLYNQADWNTALLEVVQSDMPLSAKNIALEDLDCQPRYLYYKQKRAYLTDAVAAATTRNAPFLMQTATALLANLQASQAAFLTIEAATLTARAITPEATEE